MIKPRYYSKRQMKRELKKQVDGYWTYGSYSLWEKVTEKRKGERYGIRTITVFDKQSTKIATFGTLEEAQNYVDHHLKH